MGRFHRISAVFALLAFAAGGLVGPAVHRAEHGLEHEETRRHIAAQTDHVHVEGVAVFSVSLEGLGGEHVPCALCLPTKHWRAPVPNALPGLINDRSFAPQRPVAPATVVLALLPIRGPPAVA
ncbi:MAG: hypothetical protein ABJF88_09580 [Rhodothermales bacterium]